MEKNQKLCLSSFDDATETYALTWAIRESSERNSANRVLEGIDSVKRGHPTLLEESERLSDNPKIDTTGPLLH